MAAQKRYRYMHQHIMGKGMGAVQKLQSSASTLLCLHLFVLLRNHRTNMWSAQPGQNHHAPGTAHLIFLPGNRVSSVQLSSFMFQEKKDVFQVYFQQVVLFMLSFRLHHVSILLTMSSLFLLSHQAYSILFI
jgi:hypothetical protein